MVFWKLGNSLAARKVLSQGSLRLELMVTVFAGNTSISHKGENFKSNGVEVITHENLVIIQAEFKKLLPNISNFAAGSEYKTEARVLLM